MKLLEDKIEQDGVVVGDDILKVDQFLNHQLDVPFLELLAEEFKRRFQQGEVTKILTIEASGIAIATLTGQQLGVPVVFAKKAESRNLDAEQYSSEVISFTKGRTYPIRVAKRYLHKDDRILIIDDFLAMGQAVEGLTDLIRQAQALLVGVGIVIEKGFQPGGKHLRDNGIRVESLAIIDKMQDGKIIFR